jgi:predicted Zn-dependent protease with MMP-like domain
MNFETFEKLARVEFDRVPEQYRAGVDGLIVDRDAKAHPSARDVFTLGECVTEAYPSDFGGPDTIRSAVVLYYGSFLRLSRLDPSFDWEEELWETLMHELQHHLESLADDEGLVDLDYAVEQGFQRQDGEPFDAQYYRAGEALGDGWFRVEKELFLEVEANGDAFIEFDLEGQTYRLPVPEQASDVTYVTVVDGLPPDASPLTVVLVRRRSWRAALTSLFGGREVAVAEAEAAVTPVPADPERRDG